MSLNLKKSTQDEFCFMATQHCGKTFVYFDGPSSNNSWEVFKKELELNDQKLLSVIRIPFNPPEGTNPFGLDFQNSMKILHLLLQNDDIQLAFEHLLTEVFVQGQLSAEK